MRRYCLGCSKTTGRLVERVCPALDKQREQKAARRLDKRQQIKAKEAQDPKHRMMSLFRKWKRLKAWEGDALHATLALRVRRSKWGDAWFSPGRAHPATGHITMTIGTCWANARATLVHELVHVVQGRRAGTRGHDDGFRAILVEAARELCGDHFEMPAGDSIQALDRAVARAFERADSEASR